MSSVGDIFAHMDPLAERFRLERERLGKSARELAQETKIREPYIEALERGRYDVLPAVYVRSFIRTLGAALHIPADEIASLMNATFDEESDTSGRLPAFKPPTKPREQQISFTHAAQRTSEAVAASMDKMKSVAQSPLQQAQLATSRISPLVGGAILFALFSLGIWWFVFRDKGPTDNAAGVDVVEVGTDGKFGSSDSLILTAVATDTAWLSITMDGTRTQQLIVLPEEEYRWSANEKFVVSLGNAGGVQFFRNGRPLSLFGKIGEAGREVKITRTDVTASNTTFKAPAPLGSTAPPKPATKPAAVPLVKPAAKPIAPVTKPAVKPSVKPAVKPAAQAIAKPPAKRAVTPAVKPTKRNIQTQRKRLERPLITPAPPLPVRR